MSAGAQRGPVLAVLVIGIGLVAAPAIFQMFGRAPQGAEMIDEFRPFMTEEQVALFQGYLAEIDVANDESIEPLRAEIVATGIIDDTAYDAEFPSIVALNDEWPAIQDDMGDLLDRMEDNLDNYAAVDALPNFSLFPWFFVMPGLMIVGLAAWTLWAGARRGAMPRAPLWGLVGVGLAVVLAPAVFQMFTRAPQGGDMINDFRPMMTRERVQAVQGYFVTMGAAEGDLRTAVLPLAAEAHQTDLEEVVNDYPGIAEFSEDWPTIVTDFGPMISAMSDNVENFEAIDALPSFPLFPWFFVIPGLLVSGAAFLTLRRGARPLTSPTPNEDSTTTAPDEDLVTGGTT